MRKQTVTFRIDSEKKKALDRIAEGMDRDRSYILNEAIGSYLDIHRWQVEHIKEGMRQLEAGEIASDAEVARTFARLRKGKRKAK